MPDKQPAVYILTSDRNGTLYVGVTSNLIQRIWQHRDDLAEGFSKKCRTHELVYFELHSAMEAAILREKQLKKWNRQWKLRLIEEGNPCWRDLYPDLVTDIPDKTLDSRLRGNDKLEMSLVQHTLRGVNT